MELSGTVAQNLRRAIDSARRHEGKPVYRETLQYWTDLLAYAGSVQDRSPAAARAFDGLIVKLGDLVEQRHASPMGRPNFPG